MNKDNKNAEVDNTDEKLHISDVSYLCDSCCETYLMILFLTTFIVNNFITSNGWVYEKVF